MGIKILVNNTNLCVGGGVQKALQFFISCCQWGQGNKWHFVFSAEVASSINSSELPDWITYSVSEHTPAHIVAGRSSRRQLSEEENSFDPDVVFSVFGPNYVRFRRPHLMGFAIPWITNPDSLSWTTISSPMRRVLFYLRLRYYSYWVRFADEWLFETQASSDGFLTNLNLNGSVHVIPNSCSEFYYQAIGNDIAKHPLIPVLEQGDIVLLTFTSYKPHKNIEIIPEIAQFLRATVPKKRYRFVMSLPENAAAWGSLIADARRRGVEDCLLTVGHVPVAEGPSLYAGCDALFLPSIMEVFSATYPEAMAMGKPIITSDLPFAHDVCRDAACYFDPTSATAAARAIVSVMDNQQYRDELVSAGKLRLPDFGTSKDRFQAVVDILENMVSKHGKAS
jgi:glycosyltransferase involved in cell wall biosynthesis